MIRSLYTKIVKRYVLHWGFTLYLALIWYLFILPQNLFNKPLSTILEANDGRLLSAKIAADEQWRLPPSDTIPEKFTQCLVQFEDKRFFSHPGIDLIAIVRAIGLNIKHRKIISGGSTISMQVIRLSRGDQKRTLYEKLIELILATRLELKFSKTEVLKLYSSNAPFGGNVVGLESASWRYFGKPSSLLSWGEAATLAVLPNSPGLIHPGRNRNSLLLNRDALLRRLHNNGIIKKQELNLALSEPIPEEPTSLPSNAPHLLTYLQKNGISGRLKTTIDFPLQNEVNKIVSTQANYLGFQGIYNIAVLVLDIENNTVLAYVGNDPGAGQQHAGYVDIIQSPRSTGSILKPFLYASALTNGEILPNALLPDVPLSIAGYKPENYLQSYDGVVPAAKALSRSLNVPFVKLLQQYGVPRFYNKLRAAGFTTLNNPPDHYGLSLILGGAECTLWDVTNAYAGLARTLNSYFDNSQKKTLSSPFKKAIIIKATPKAILTNNMANQSLPFTSDAIHFTFQAMSEVIRPDSEGDWKRFDASRKIAWKTGTSYGYKDAWAIGVDTKYAVGVWVGNADGESRPGLIGVYSAAPLLFEVFQKLPPTGKWFETPFDDLEQAVVCKESGFLAGEFCPFDTTWTTRNALQSKVCPFHKLLHLTEDEKYQVSVNCIAPNQMVNKGWFVLTPSEEYYFRKKHPDYLSPPPMHPNCSGSENSENLPIELIYPNSPSIIVPPRDLNGYINKVILKASHRNPKMTLFWHLDNVYLGSTTGLHTMEIVPTDGKHVIVVVDEDGNTIRREFEIKIK